MCPSGPAAVSALVVVPVRCSSPGQGCRYFSRSFRGAVPTPGRAFSSAPTASFSRSVAAIAAVCDLLQAMAAVVSPSAPAIVPGDCNLAPLPEGGMVGNPLRTTPRQHRTSHAAHDRRVHQKPVISSARALQT